MHRNTHEVEWRENLDSWKSRRRKMSEDVVRRQEELKELLEMDVQEPVGQQKKVKTFSEMVEERASKGRTLSLCLFSNPLGLDDWSAKEGFKDDSEMSCNDTHQSSQSSGSEGSSNENSEDESDVFHNTQTAERNGVKNVNNTPRTRRTGAVHFLGNHNGVNNGIISSTEDNGSNCDFKVSDLRLNGETLSHKCEPCQGGVYNDSGLDSLSSSHRAGDIPDSGSDFSQDSGSSLDCDSPGITGIPTSGTELLEEFSSKDVRPSNGMISHKEKIDGMELCLKLTLSDSKSQQYGFTISGGKDKGSPVTVASVINGSISDLVGLKTGDHILSINKEDITSLSHSSVISSLKQSAENKQLELLVLRPVSTNVKQEKPTVNGSSATTPTSESPKKAVPEQTTNKEICNKTNSKATKVLSVPESSVDSKVDIVDSQSNNKKATPVKQKDINNKTPVPVKPQTQEISGSTSVAAATAKGNTETAASAVENQHGKSVESENEMFVDDFPSGPVSNSSKIPVAERSPKVMGKRLSKAPQESKKNKSPVSESSKSEENNRKTNVAAIEDLKDSSLNIIYQSQPSVPKVESNAKELVSADSEHSVSSSADKKVVNGSPKSPAQASTNKQEPKFNEKLTFETSEILPVDKVAEQMERLILEQLEAEERLKEKPLNSEASLHGSVITTTANVLSEHELSGIDTPPRQVEPPKEKPPPPPTSSSSTNKDSPLKRVNSTKRIKKEIQKRRSDFLGIEKPEEEESTIPPPPDLENILKLECEQERKVREMLGKESLHQRESSFEEEEIARKEREIIENLETEERLRLAKPTVKDESVSSSPSPGDASFAQIEAERIRKLQEERVRMEEERFMKEEQRIRLEEERQLREREEQIRREEAQKPGDLSAPLTQSPCASVANVTETDNSGNNTGKQKDISVDAPVNANAGAPSKTLKIDSAPKTPPVVATSPKIQHNEKNKKPTFVKKNKQESKKSKADKQNVTAKNDNKTSVKSEPQETKSQVVQTSDAQNKMPENIPCAVKKEAVPKVKNTDMSKSDTSPNSGQNKGVASQAKDAKSDVSASEQKPKTPEESIPYKQSLIAKSDNKASVKTEPKSQVVQLSGVQSKMKENIPSDVEKETVEIFKPSDIFPNAKENKAIASQTNDAKSASVAEQKSKTSEVSKTDKQKNTVKNDKTPIKSEPKGQAVQPCNVQNQTAEDISLAVEKVVSKVTSSETPKSSEVSLNVEGNKAIASQTEDAKSSASSSKQKRKIAEASKDQQQNNQTSSQNDNVKNKRSVFEQKSKDLSNTQDTKQNKNTSSQKGSLRPTPVSQQESDSSVVSPSGKQAHQQNEDGKTKVLISKHMSPAFEVFQNVEKVGDTPCGGGIMSKRWPSKQEPQILESQNYDAVVDITAKTCMSETKPKDTEVSCAVEVTKVAVSQGVNSTSNSQVVQNAEQKVANSQSEGEVLKIPTSEQKSEASENRTSEQKKMGDKQISEQKKMGDKQTETTKSNKSIPMQKPEVSDVSQNIEKKQNISPMENSGNKACVSEQNSRMAPASPSTERSKDTSPQVETKTEKSVPEQKPGGNVVRVRRKKKGMPPKPIDLGNSGGPELSNKTGKYPPSPTKRTKPEDKTSSSGVGHQNQDNSSSLCVGARTADTKSETKKVAVPTQNECNKPVNQKSNSVKEISSITTSVTGKDAECTSSSNTKVESTSGVSATASSSVLSTNSENTALVSTISSSVSHDASLSETGDGKNKDSACMPPASGDQSSIAKETANNLVPTKPLKKKEVIRKERERLRQEQEALQREREEYRRQMMKEQEMLKESQKPHAPDAPVSCVGAPPPLKPALPLPLTSLPHASQALKENVIYTSRSPPANSVSAAVGNHGAGSQSAPLLGPSHNAAARPKATQNEARGSHKVPVKKQLDTSSESRYNQNHWLIQEAEMRRISEQKERQRVHPSGDLRCAPSPFNQGQYHPMHIVEENYCGAVPGALQKPPVIPGAPSLISKSPSNYPAPTQMHSPEQQWNYGQPVHPTPQNRKFPISNVLSPGTEKIQPPTFPRNGRVDPSMQPPTKPSRVIPMDRQEQMLSVSGRKRCSHCGEELGRGAAMIIESLQLYYHIQCFRCCVCQAQLGNGSCGTDVRVRNNKLHCHNCYSNDEAGLKFSQV